MICRSVSDLILYGVGMVIGAFVTTLVIELLRRRK